MKVQDVSRLSVKERFTYWIQERESIRLRKEAGQSPPWTDDEILQQYRFCNVRRMDDKVSRWLMDNWYRPNFNHPNMLVACALARFFNLPASLEAIGFPTVWEPKKIRNCLRKQQKRGLRVFNGAYMVRGNDGVDKIASVINYCLKPLEKRFRRLIIGDSMQNAWVAITPFYGFGSFMAGQVVADLRWAMRGAWADSKTWAPMGPGSRRGMNRLLERPIKQPLKQGQFIAELQELVQSCRRLLPGSITSRLEMIDYQNCLCEFDKYSRALTGEGRPKQLYHGT